MINLKSCLPKESLLISTITLPFDYHKSLVTQEI